MVKAEDIRKLVESAIEPSEPVETIMRVLSEYDGKKWSDEILDKIRQEVRCNISVVSDIDMFHIRWDDGTESGSGLLLIAYQSKRRLVIDPEWIKDANEAYFAARIERNKTRNNLLAGDNAIFDKMAAAINEYNIAASTLESMLSQFSVDKYVIMDLVSPTQIS